MEPFDFSTGTTNPDTFPVEAFATAAAAAIRTHGVELNTYPGKLGHLGLRQLMAEREFDREGVRLDPDRIMLTNGSMQAVTLVAEALAEGQDDIVLMEEYCYSGTVAAYRALGMEMIGVPLDGQGMRIDALASTLESLHSQNRPPRFIYTLPTYQNPTGAVMPRERRLALLKVAKQYDCLVVEDNCYGDVHYETFAKPPALYSLEGGPDQLYLCSLSKVFAPGVRLGYITASSDELFQRLVARRHDAGPNTVAAAITWEYLKDGFWEHCDMANAGLKLKRDAMLAGLEAELGNTCSWSRPAGGMFIWVRLPDGVDPIELQVAAAKHEVSFALGSDFHVHGDEGPYIRLAFGFAKVPDITEGMARLARSIESLRPS
jgi:2-aminoadipate transaminase